MHVPQVSFSIPELKFLSRFFVDCRQNFAMFTIANM
jgi:hypothetical protein